jgi:hypothetical protein
LKLETESNLILKWDEQNVNSRSYNEDHNLEVLLDIIRDRKLENNVYLIRLSGGVRKEKQYYIKITVNSNYIKHTRIAPKCLSIEYLDWLLFSSNFTWSFKIQERHLKEKLNAYLMNIFLRYVTEHFELNMKSELLEVFIQREVVGLDLDFH